MEGLVVLVIQKRRFFLRESRKRCFGKNSGVWKTLVSTNVVVNDGQGVEILTRVSGPGVNKKVYRRSGWSMGFLSLPVINSDIDVTDRVMNRVSVIYEYFTCLRV